MSQVLSKIILKYTLYPCVEAEIYIKMIPVHGTPASAELRMANQWQWNGCGIYILMSKTSVIFLNRVV